MQDGTRTAWTRQVGGRANEAASLWAVRPLPSSLSSRRRYSQPTAHGGAVRERSPAGSRIPARLGEEGSTRRCGAASCRGWGRSCPQCRRLPRPELRTVELRRWAAAVPCACCWLLRCCLPAPSPRPTSKSAKVTRLARFGQRGRTLSEGQQRTSQFVLLQGSRACQLLAASFGRMSPEQPEK